ncbi:hypothetical protein DUI87_10320 [Hirundo rustica rustica]|uniref:Uncharacterized protein n=1 Tax=Hirundo rustica rustica TaxID=333673 RepID=A0A3M0KI76_HIRRU|nr:hypothetical protein DUI87_10320 [Hirundo rustica rustica]
MLLEKRIFVQLHHARSNHDPTQRRFGGDQPVYINIIRDPVNRFLSNYFFRRFGDWRGEQNHMIRTPNMRQEERYLEMRYFESFKFLGSCANGIGWIITLRVAVSGSVSKQRPVANGIPWGQYWDWHRLTSSLVSLTVGSKCILSKFADDTKLSGVVDMQERKHVIQRHLDKLRKWALVNFMEFNKAKYKFLHLSQDSTFVSVQAGG